MSAVAEPVANADPEWNGAIPAGGLSSVLRIPIPGPGNLAIELSPRNWKGKSTSTLFFQGISGKPNLRLDYGWNKSTQTVDYHWNHEKAFARFGIPDHTPAGRGGAVAYQGFRAFKYLGRTLLVIGLATDVYSIAKASSPLRRSTEVVSAWAMAAVMAPRAGLLGAEIGAVGGPIGMAVGGVVFAFAGAAFGYWLGEKSAVAVWDWAADTVFTPLDEDLSAPVFSGGGGGRSGGGGASGSW